MGQPASAVAGNSDRCSCAKLEAVSKLDRGSTTPEN